MQNFPRSQEATVPNGRARRTAQHVLPRLRVLLFMLPICLAAGCMTQPTTSTKTAKSRAEFRAMCESIAVGKELSMQPLELRTLLQGRLYPGDIVILHEPVGSACGCSLTVESGIVTKRRTGGCE